MKLSFTALAIIAASSTWVTLSTADATEPARIDTQLEQRIIEWRRDIHQHPELSNREFRTAALVAEHLNN